MEKHFSKAEFELYSLLYAANLDMQFSEEEMTLLCAEVEPHTFDLVYEKFKNDNDSEHVKTVLQYKENYLKTKEDIDQFFDSLKSVFFADNKFSSLEMYTFGILKKMF